MAYNQRNLLEKIIEIKAIVSEYRRKGSTQRWIYENQIKNKYHISESTFNNYLARNAKRELRELDELDAKKAKQRSCQLNLFL